MTGIRQTPTRSLFSGLRKALIHREEWFPSLSDVKVFEKKIPLMNIMFVGIAVCIISKDTLSISY